MFILLLDLDCAFILLHRGAPGFWWRDVGLEVLGHAGALRDCGSIPMGSYPPPLLGYLVL